MTLNYDIEANTRSIFGSAESRRIRKSGKIPAVIYGKDGQNQNIIVDGKNFERQYFKGNIFTTIANIKLDGKAVEAIAHKIELNPVTDRPDHIDFFTFEKGGQVKVKTKINFTNKDKSIGLKRGGFLHVVLRRVEILCNIDSIPESIDIDISSLRVGAKIRGSDIKLPENVSFVAKKEFVVASIIGRGSKDDDKAQENADSISEAEEGSKTE